MRRKSERTAGKKGKASPEKKLEKVKRTRTRRRKHSSSSENDSADDKSPVREVEAIAETEKKPPSTPAKEDSPEEAQDQVWHVKTAESSGDVGEIQKLKICLTRPPSTPERVDRSPRSKRKHSRATSSSDTPSVEAVEEKKKSKHRSKRSTRGSKDGSDKNNDSQGDEVDTETEPQQGSDKGHNEITQSIEAQSEVVSDETPMSTTSEEVKPEGSKTSDAPTPSHKPAESATGGNTNEPVSSEKADEPVSSEKADEPVSSEKADEPAPSEKADEPAPSEKADEPAPSEKADEPAPSEKADEPAPSEKADECTPGGSNKYTTDETMATDADIELQSKSPDADTTVASPRAEADVIQVEINTSYEKHSPKYNRSESVERSEILEIHADESRGEALEQDSKTEEDDSKEDKSDDSRVAERTSSDREVSINEEKSGKSISEEAQSPKNDSINATNKTDVVESTERVEKARPRSTSPDSGKDKEVEDSKKRYRSKELQHSDTTHAIQGETVHNGETVPIVISRKRKWGSRPKLSTQKSITISTDVLKEIIPDVTPVEFDEVIEEKKQHKRVEAIEKLERPVLPKIVIDNTENVEQHRKEQEDKDKENIKIREPHLSTNRKISIVKDNDSILVRPPSPPRHKQSNILYITNLVRPFTLPQLKNLLQRTGRIVENGFWIDRIKSKCFVKYETEDQAVETRHALHGVTWPVSNPKTLQVDFSTQEAFDKSKLNEETDNAQASTIPGTVEDWLREQDQKRERGEVDKPWERKAAMREWDVGKNEKEKEKDKLRRDERPLDKRRHRTPERSPEPAKKFKKKEEEAPAKLLDDLFRKTKTTPCIYWLPLSAETIAIKEEQRRQHMAEHERRLQELRRTHRRH